MRIASVRRPNGWSRESCGKTTISVGTALDDVKVRRAFRLITKKAGIGEDWTPCELRHSFVSIMSDSGVSIETIADLCGHAGTAVTEEVYRHQLKPVIAKGAETINAVFKKQTV